MNTPRVHLTDADLDQALDAYLVEAPITAAERVAERAMLAVTTTRQRRRSWLGSFVPSSARAGLATAMTVVAVVIGFGVWKAVEVSVTPTPTPSPSAPVGPTPTPVPTPFTLDSYSYPALGWEISLPANWSPQSAERLPTSYRRFSGIGEPGGFLEVSLGSVDGTIDTCILGRCLLHTVRSISEFDAILGVPAGFPFVSGPTDVTVDGEPGQQYSVVNLDNVSGPQEQYVVALHDGRPLFVHYHRQGGKENYPLGRILSGLWFIDPVVLVPFQSGDGYRLSLPDTWQAGAGGTCPGVQTFSGQRTPFGSLTVSYGDTDGVYHTLTGGPTDCQRHEAANVADLRTQIVGDGLFAMQVTDEVSATLAEEPALKITGKEFLASTPEAYVVAFHDGRPIVLRFTFDDGSVDAGLVADIVASFQFAQSGGTYAYPDLGFSIAIPTDWTLYRDDRGVRVSDSTGVSPFLIISTTNADGQMTVCRWGSPEDCSEGPFTAADQLADAIGPRPDPSCLLCATLRRESEVALGSDAVTLYSLFTFDGTLYYLFDVHNGRPYVLFGSPTSVTIGDGGKEAQVRSFLDQALLGFTFLP